MYKVWEKKKMREFLHRVLRLSVREYKKRSLQQKQEEMKQILHTLHHEHKRTMQDSNYLKVAWICYRYYNVDNFHTAQLYWYKHFHLFLDFFKHIQSTREHEFYQWASRITKYYVAVNDDDDDDDELSSSIHPLIDPLNNSGKGSLTVNHFMEQAPWKLVYEMIVTVKQSRKHVSVAGMELLDKIETPEQIASTHAEFKQLMDFENDADYVAVVSIADSLYATKDEEKMKLGLRYWAVNFPLYMKYLEQNILDLAQTDLERPHKSFPRRNLKKDSSLTMTALISELNYFEKKSVFDLLETRTELQTSALYISLKTKGMGAGNGRDNQFMNSVLNYAYDLHAES
jgi:hypothetical protein